MTTQKPDARQGDSHDAKHTGAKHGDTKHAGAEDPHRDNPKINPEAGGASNQIKDPDDWVSGGEPMTGAQASYLKTLSEQAHNPEAFDPDLDKAEASKRIDALKHDTAR